MNPLHDQIAAFLEYGETQKGYSSHTAKSYGWVLRRFARWTDQRPAVDAPFNLEAIRTFQIERQTESALRPRSMRLMQCAFAAFGHWLVETGGIVANPCRAIKNVRMDDPIVRGASEIEARALLEGCSRLPGRLPSRGIMAKALMSVFLFAGLRRAELLSLEISDCNLLDRRILVRLGKGGKSRSIPMNTDLHAALEAWLAVRRAPACIPALFLHSPSRPLSSYSLRTLLDHIKATAGLRDRDYLRPHSFRRYFATSMERNGAGLAAISKLMGHGSIAITCLYLMTDEKDMAAAVELSVPRAPVEPIPLRSLQGGREERRVPPGPRRSIRLRTA